MYVSYCCNLRKYTLTKTSTLTLSCFVILWAITSFAGVQSFKAGSEPGGFGDLQWGTDVEKIEGMRYLKDADIGGSLPPDIASIYEKSFPQLQLYERDGEKLRFGNAGLRSITYAFYKGKLCEVMLSAEGTDNWDMLKDEVFAKFGRSDFVNLPGHHGHDQHVEYYVWSGQISEMELVYSHSSSVSNLWIGSMAVREQIFQEAREKNKKSKEDLDESQRFPSSR